MNKFQLFKTLRTHNSLADKRNPAVTQNKVAKVFLWIGAAFILLYLIGFAIMFALIANESHSTTASELIFGIAPFILALDFFFRFIAQQTPSQQIKPYILLPISRYTCIDCFIANSLLSVGNLTWFAMLIPYSIMSIVFSEGIGVTLGCLAGFYVLILINSQWYMLARSLINRHIAWWVLPLIVYALIFLPAYAWKGADMAKCCQFYADGGYLLATWKPLPWLFLFAVLAILIYINRRLQYRFVYAELSRTETTKLHHVSQFKMFDRFEETGEYLKLEVKSIMRNKNIKKGFIFATVAVALLSFAISFSDIYNNMVVFWCIYNFAIYGAMILVKVMCHEGNYIECLMVRQENIVSLLRAKYYFYTALLLLPLLLMLPMVVTGKCSLMMLLAVMVFTAGFLYFLFFQMAVYNKQTIPLNSKFVGKGSMETNYLQLLVEILVFAVPLILISVLKLVIGETPTYLVLMAIGFAFIATHKLWIRNIYRRMMKRKYENLEGFRSTISN